MLYFRDPDAKALVYGLSLSSELNDFLKAVLEGITFEQYLGYANVVSGSSAEDGFQPMAVIGGGSRFLNWVQIKSDIFRRPMRTLREHDAASLGALVLAGYGSGAFSEDENVLSRFNSEAALFLPNEQMYHYYELADCVARKKSVAAAKRTLSRQRLIWYNYRYDG